MSDQPSRRHFLKTGCIVTAAAGVTLIGGGALAATYQPAVDLPAATFGAKSTGNRILIAYASKAGSTANIAASMADSLAKQNLRVDVQPVTSATDLSPYKGIILGSAIRVGKLLPEAMDFIKKNQTILLEKTFNVFIVCMTLSEDNAETRKTVSAYLNPLRELVKPANEGLFAGMMEPNKLKLFERLIIMAMKVPTGDFRKWDQIHAWAEKAVSI